MRCPRKGVQKLRSLPFFRETARGIGYSFQLAITTPRINLIGYGTATAQSWQQIQLTDSYTVFWQFI